MAESTLLVLLGLDEAIEDHQVSRREIAQDLSNKDVSGGVIRRPTAGIQLKKDTVASITVLGNVPRGLVNSSVDSTSGDMVGRSSITHNFMLEGLTESRSEKFQPITTFGPAFGYFMGEQPRMLQGQGRLINTRDFSWLIEWWDNYASVLRGTQLTSKGARAYLTVDDRVFEGYFVSANVGQNSGDPHSAQFSFQFWVTNEDVLVTPGLTRVDPRHEPPASSRYIEFDEELAPPENEVPDEGLPWLDTLIAASRAPGQFTGAIGRQARRFAELAYGRRIVLPQGFAASEVTARPDRSGPVTILVPRFASRLSELTPPRSFYQDRPDEYTSRQDGPPADDYENVYPHRVPEHLSRSNSEQAAINRAEREFGSVPTGNGKYADLVRIAAKASFGVATVAGQVAVDSLAKTDAERRLFT